ncbi:hypothetical protein DPEC_G00112180 [Dallia pectoralis]|uniref:Uncharacterized protein n=1 Tax=Dallia pectoralis TaxID=75939 RepID=A0ACC2GTF2_DALPE|nr:hypothetical protein DPEC_G00112180 [Dallia pectoralis]
MSLCGAVLLPKESDGREKPPAWPKIILSPTCNCHQDARSCWTQGGRLPSTGPDMSTCARLREVTNGHGRRSSTMTEKQLPEYDSEHHRWGDSLTTSQICDS